MPLKHATTAYCRNIPASSARRVHMSCTFALFAHTPNASLGHLHLTSPADSCKVKPWTDFVDPGKSRRSV